MSDQRRRDALDFLEAVWLAEVGTIDDRSLLRTLFAVWANFGVTRTIEIMRQAIAATPNKKPGTIVARMRFAFGPILDAADSTRYRARNANVVDDAVRR